MDAIKPLAASTRRRGADASLGGFGALFDLKAAGFQDPILVSSTDGVGTKLKIAIETGRHDGVGIDLVAMVVNDILVQGAEPVFFLDYFACGKLDVETAARVVGGIARGCELAGCALIGGETAEMPGMYPPGEYDLAGFAVGIAEKSQLITGETIAQGDVVLGLASSGAHSNGYSLLRKILERDAPDMDADFHGRTLRETVLEPTRIYVRSLLALMKEAPGLIKGLAHITGGGLLDNVPRVLPAGLAARIEASSWPLPPLFAWLREAGKVAEQEMYRVFNCGIGMVVIVSSDDADAATRFLSAAGETVYRIGRIECCDKDAAQTVVR